MNLLRKNNINVKNANALIAYNNWKKTSSLDNWNKKVMLNTFFSSKYSKKKLQKSLRLIIYQVELIIIKRRILHKS